MQAQIQKIEQGFMKKSVVAVKSGDTVKVTQKIKEGSKERLQVFEGLVIRTRRMGSHTATIAVRRVASGIGVEKTFMLHSPLVTKVEVTKRSKVRRNYLTYMRDRSGKSARLDNVGFDASSVNIADEPEEESKQEEAKESDGNSKEDSQNASEASSEQEVAAETKEEKAPKEA